MFRSPSPTTASDSTIRSAARKRPQSNPSDITPGMEASREATRPPKSQEAHERVPTFAFPRHSPHKPPPAKPSRSQADSQLSPAPELVGQTNRTGSHSAFSHQELSLGARRSPAADSQPSTAPLPSAQKDQNSNSASDSQPDPSRRRLRRSFQNVQRSNQGSQADGPSTSVSAGSTSNTLHRCENNNNNTNGTNSGDHGYLPPPSTQAQAHFQGQPQGSLPASASSTPGGSLSLSIPTLQYLDHERIVRWRHTATILPQGTIPSPVSPRRFTELEMDMDSGRGAKRSGSNVTQETGDSEAGIPQSVDEENQDTGPVYSALKNMWELQEGARSEQSRKDNLFDGELDGNANGNETQQAQCLSGSPGPAIKLDKGKGKAVEPGDPIKVTPRGPSRPSSKTNKVRTLKAKPPPLQIPPIHPLSSHPPSDPQTYTTSGLLTTLRALYHPTSLPSPLLTSLPPSPLLSTLSNPTTPLGSKAQHRTLTSPQALILDSKGRNYIAFFIDTLLTKLRDLSDEVVRLEEECEDKEVQKAGMQGEIGFWYNEGRAYCLRAEGLEKVVVGLMGEVQIGRRNEVVKLAEECGIDVMEIWGRLGGDDRAGSGSGKKTNGLGVGEENGGPSLSKGKEPVRNGDGGVVENEDHVGSDAKSAALEKRLRRSECDIQYWRARAEAAEKYVKAIQGDDDA